MLRRHGRRLLLLFGDEILWGPHTGQAEALLNPLHALAVAFSDASTVTAEVDVELFEGLVLCLGHHEPHEEGAAAAERSEEEVRAPLHTVQHVSSGQADDEIEHPVGGSHDGDAARAHRVGEDLLREHPGHGTPGVREVDAEEPDERH